MTGGTGGMKTDEPKNSLGALRKEGHDAAEERMEDWFHEGTSSEFEEGEVVRGRVVQVTSTEVLVDVGYKSEGAIPIEEFHRHGKLPRVGEEIEVYLEAKEDSEGLIVLSKDKADKIKVWDAIMQAHEKGLPVEGRIVEVVKGGVAVDVGVKAFLPGSQVDLRPVKNLPAMVGQTIRAKVIKVNRRRGNVVLSRRAVLEEEREEKKKHTLEVLSEGMVLTGTVKNITDYGAFIDLGGIDGLLHVTDMSWGRVGHPSKLVNVGDEVDVIVLDVNRAAKRISLGMKQVEPDPWATIEERYRPGTRVAGKVRNLTDFGAFIELEPGVDGLLHISDMSWTRSVGHPSEILKKGQEIETQILNIDKENKRISLGLKQIQPEGDPLVLLVDVEDLRLDLLPLLENFRRVADAAGPGHVGDVQEAIHAGLELDERAEVGQVAHLPRDPRPRAVALLDRRPRVGLVLFHAERDALRGTVDVEHDHG